MPVLDAVGIQAAELTMIRLVAIESLPVGDNAAWSSWHDETYATLEITDSAGRMIARPRVPLADLGVTQTKEELLALIEQEGAQAVSLTLQV